MYVEKSNAENIVTTEAFFPDAVVNVLRGVGGRVVG